MDTAAATVDADAPVYMTVDAYIKADSKIRRTIERHSGHQSVVVIRVGRWPYSVALYFADTTDIDRITEELAHAKHDLIAATADRRSM